MGVRSQGFGKGELKEMVEKVERENRRIRKIVNRTKEEKGIQVRERKREE